MTPLPRKKSRGTNSRRRREDNFEVILKEIMLQDDDSINLAQNRIPSGSYEHCN
jgi:hypothetical protein